MKKIFAFFSAAAICFCCHYSYSQSVVFIGNETNMNNPTSFPAPYGNWYGGVKHQFLVSAAEMISGGAAAGNIYSLGFNVVTVAGTPLQSFTIKIKNAVLGNFVNNFDTVGFTTVFGPVSYAETGGWNIHNFSSPFYWDGSSNLIVEVCFYNTSYTQNAVTYYSSTGFNSTIYNNQDGNPAICNISNGITSTYRPNMRFSMVPLVDFSVSPSTGCKPLNVGFSIAGPAATNYKIYYDNGTYTQIYYGPSTSVSYSFSQADDYNVFVEAFDGGGAMIAQGSTNISVYGNAIGQIYNVPQDSACPNTEVTFQYNYYDALSVAWDFGDGYTANGSNVSHSFSTLDSFLVQAFITTNCGIDTISKVYKITNSIVAIPIQFSHGPEPACINSLVGFYPYSNTAGYSWDFGDGFSDTASTPYHSYSTPGTFLVTFTNTNGCGSSASFTDSVHIVSYMPFDSMASITFSPDSACPNESVNFWAPSGGEMYIFDFDDGSQPDTGTSYYRNHYFPYISNFNVTVKVFNSCGNDTTYSVIVPIVNTIGFPSGMVASNNSPMCPNETVVLSAPYGYLGYTWDFGDSSPVDSSGNPNSYHNYSSIGSYVASVSFYNNCGLDTTLTTTVDITSNSGFPNGGYLSTSTSFACPNENIGFYAQGGYMSYVFNYGDGSPSDSTSNTAGYHTYSSIGTYTASVTIYNNCGNDTVIFTTVVISNNQPVPNFVSLSSNSPVCPGGNVNLNINLSGLSYYLWDYGDGSPIDSVGNAENGWSRNHTYGSVGNYLVSATVFNSCGNDTVLYTSVVISSASPFPSSVYTGHNTGQACPNDVIGFYAESSYVSYHWNFGDGSPVVTTYNHYTDHAYASAGTYFTSVTIYNACGNDTLLYDTVVVGSSAYFPNWVEVYANNPGACPGQGVSFNSNYGNASSYVWNFGDGSPSITTQYSNSYHTYTALGTYTVSLTITNNCGNDTTVSTIYNVAYPPFPAMNININQTPACPNQSIEFGVQNGFYKYIWNYGDGSQQYVNYGGGWANHSYAGIGTYIVSVKVLQNCGADPYQYPNLYKDTTVYDTVVISNNLGFSGAAFINANPGSCSDDYFFNGPSGYYSYFWDFGDGDTITTFAGNNGDPTGTGGGESSSHSYDSTGTYVVSLTMENYCGSDSTVTTTIIINQLSYGSFIPSWDTSAVYLYANPSTVCPGQMVNFNTGANSYLGYFVQTAIWDFGDGSGTDTINNPQGTSNGIYNNHLFSQAGTYTTEVTLIHHCGNDTMINSIVVVDTTLGFPNGAFLSSNVDPCIGEETFLYATSGFPSYEWDFGDSTAPVTSSNFYFPHQYSSAGTFSASVTITNYCGIDTTIFDSIIVVDYKPFPSYSFLQANPTNPCPGENVNLWADAGWNNVSYFWNFGDGDTVTLFANDNGNPGGTGGGNYIYHVFDSVGVYNVSVTVTNKCGNDTTLQVTLNVVGYKPFPSYLNINANPNPACPGDNLYFNAYSGFASYQWDFGDGTTGPNYPYVNHSYDSVGADTVILTVTNFCGNDTTLYKIITIEGNIEFGPYTPFGQSWFLYGWPYNACPGQNVQFQAPDGLPYYVWDFGDGVIDSTSNYSYNSHKYDSVGPYSVSVTIRNNCGSDTTLFTNIVIDNNVGFSNLYMNVSPSVACPMQEVQINGPYGYASYVFDFGDGSPVDSSWQSSTFHSFPSAGTYNVGLTIYNFCGKDTTIYAPVNIDTGVVFTSAPQVNAYPNIVCPGQEISFSTASGHMTYVWNFDDGVEAQGTSYVHHSYDTLGTFGVEVNITNFCGNDITASVNVTVSDTITTFPNMSMDVSPPVSCPGDMVELSVYGSYSSYFWTFGDGDTLTTSGYKVQHIYGAQGNYNSSVVITNGCGFSTTVYQSISINGSAPIDTAFALSVPFNPNCPGDEVFFNIENGASTYIYDWDFSDGTSDSTVGTGTTHIFSDTGSYPVSVTATNGCGNSKTISVVAEIDNNILPVLESGETFGFGTGQSSSIAGCPGDAVLFWFAGTYDNVWDFGDGSTGTATEQVNTDMGVPITVAKYIYPSEGTYTATLTLTNECGNSITDSVQIQISNNQLVNGSIFIAPPSGTSGYTTCSSIDMIATGGSNYSWDFGDGDTITTISPTISHTFSDSGTYTVSVKVINGCGFSATYYSTISVNGIGGPSATVAGAAATCYGGNSGSATVTVIDGMAPFTYLWDVNAGSQTGATATGLMAGTYSVSIIDNLGCSSVENVTISQPSDMAISATVNSSTCGASDGSAVVTVSGGTGGPYSYYWSNGSTVSFATGLYAGNYTVTVTNGNGCTKVGNISVNNGNSATVALTSSVNVSCYGGSDGSANISVGGGTSPYTYLWSDSSTTEDPGNLAAGTYSVTVTDANNCFSGVSVQITQPSDLSLSTVVGAANCGTNNGSATVNPAGGTGPYTYLWGSNTQNKTTQTVSGLFAGNYKVTVTDANGCVDSTLAVINNANAPVVTSVVSNVTCSGMNNGSIALNISQGTYPYLTEWNFGSTDQTITGLVPGYYSVVITDGSQCKLYRSYTITQPGVLAATASFVAASCGNADGSATVTHTGGNTSFSYLWNNGQTNSTATGLAAGSYSVTVTDNKGCDTVAGVTVTQPSTFASSTTADSVSCNSGNDGSASVTAAGGNSPYDYNWSSADSTAVISGLSAGTYTVTITDVNNCLSNNSVTIGEPSAVSLTLSSTMPLCVGDSNGTAGISLSGGTPPYTIGWSSGGNSTAETNLVSGMYYVSVTDDHNCNYSDSVAVNDPFAINISFSVSDVECFGNLNGSVDAGVSGGASPYTYSWSSGGSSATENNLAAGMYYVTVTDSNNCVKPDSVFVAEPLQLSSSISGVDASCNNVCDGTALVTPSGGTSPYTYLWSNGDNGTLADSLCVGNFVVNISDANNCQATQNITITEPDSLAVSISSVGTTCGNTDGYSVASALGGTIPYSYLWSDSQTDSTATGLGTGVISVVVTDSNGCTASAVDSIETYVPSVDVCLVTVDSTSTKNLVVWEKPGVNYIDSFRVYREIVGTYSYIGSVDYLDLSKFVDNTNGVNPQITSYKYKISAVDNCGNESDMSSYHKTMHLQTIIQSGEVDLSWDNYDGFGTGFYYRILRDSTGAGNWQVIDSVSFGNTQYTDINPPSGIINYMMEVVHPYGGCLATKSVENHNSSRSNRGQSANGAPLSATASSTDASSGNCDGTATVTATGGFQPYAYLWDNNAANQTTETATGLCPGNYTVSVTDSVGTVTTATVTVLSAGSTLSVTVNTNDATAGNCNGVATAVSTGGTSPYSYQWSSNANGQTSGTVTGLCAGVYTVTVTDNDGNSFVASGTVGIIGSTLGATASATNTTDTVNCNGTATVTATGGTTPYTYLWSNGQTSAVATGLCAGSYSVSVTDGDGNTAVASATVGVTVQPSVAELSLENAVLVFPNPNKGEFNVVITDQRFLQADLKIYNLLGEVIYQLLPGYRKSDLHIDLSRHGAGIYYLQVVSEGRIVNKKVVVE